MSKFNSYLLFSFFLFCFLPFHGSAQTPDQEQTILLTLKQHWNNPPSLAQWTPSSNASSHCAWVGIQCTNASVTAISLFNSSISGTIPSLFCDLPNLQSIDLHYNKIRGEFPEALYRCSKLQYLDLSSNSFVGPLPRDIHRLTELRTLSVSDNNFTGSIPAAIGRFPLLKNLSLGATYLNGTFPPEIGNLSNLEMLEMADIGFTPSALPPSLTRLKKLSYIFIARSNLVGEIPKNMGDMEALEYLDLSQNKLSGSIPSSLFLLKNLSIVYLYKNTLSGEIPPIRASNLAELDVGQNNLTGNIPDEIGKLETLVYLSLFSNQLSGQIPESVGRLPQLTDVKLFSNNFSGPLPSDIGRYSPLARFEVADNKLSGSLPESLCSDGQLIGLVAFNNHFTGELPVSLSNCSTLQILMVYGNRFSGTISPALWSSTSLQTIMISDNMFTGKLPQKLAWNLTRLQMNNNRFSGEIPVGFPSQKRLVVFEARNNLLQGSVPGGLTALPNLVSLLLDGNNLSGQLPTEMISWESLTTLNLSRNKISGPIPSQIGRLPHLTYLDLSDNRFSGQIPATVADQRLLMLNLSSNNLSGRIPGDLDNPMYQSSFSNNAALCSSNPSTVIIKSCYNARSRKSGHSSRFVAVTFSIVAALVLALALLFSFFLIHALRRSKQEQMPNWKLTSFQRVNFTDADVLSKLTENNVIGSGGSGKVYRVVVNQSRNELVAVKKIRSDMKLDRNLEGEFRAEFEILSTLRHSNIVKLICCVHSEDSKLLVYEYLENRSLDLWLHGIKRAGVTASIKRDVLDWPKRLHIAVGAAQGLCYMHQHCVPPVIHRDVKSSNILLDSEFNAKIADFGLARLLMKHGEPNTMSAVAGSFGYMAPEYAKTMRVDQKVDVYSFGVVLLELVTGREAGDGGERGSVAEWAGFQIQQGIPIHDILDKDIKEACYLNEMSSVFKLGVLCTRSIPSTRPSMRDVLQVLLQCRDPGAYGVKKVKTEYEGAPLLKSAAVSSGDFVSVV